MESIIENSEIPQFYAERSVFVTGSTGFLGKILAEKLLRSCPDMKTLYLLIRPKGKKSSKERLEAVLNTQCFDVVRKECPTFKNKVVAVAGDLVEPLCGISDKDLENLRRDVSIVFHSAARVKFTDPLRTAVMENVIGTRHVVELCKELPHLKAYVHLSTAFSRREVDGAVPEAVIDFHTCPYKVLNTLDLLDDTALEKITPSIIKDGSTTYQFSKALAEAIVEKEKGNIPVTIVRPCVVCQTWKEPFPGWSDVLQGIPGLFVAGGKGFLRAIYAPPGYKVYVVPADVVVNCIIVSAWYTAKERPEGTFVVNCTLDYQDFPPVRELFETFVKLREKYPLSTIYRYPDCTIYRYRFLYKIHALVDHYIPAVIIDSLLCIFTGKTLMMRLYKKVDTLSDIFLKQGSVPWYFKLENYNKIRDSMSPKDAEVFFLNVDNFNWLEYVDSSARGGRQFLCKEDPSTIPYAVMKGRIWWLVTSIIKWCIILYFFYCLILRFL